MSVQQLKLEFWFCGLKWRVVLWRFSVYKVESIYKMFVNK